MRFSDLLHPKSAAPRIQIVSKRSDGLGVRLVSIIHGLYLAKLLDVPFKFSWRTEVVNAAGHEPHRIASKQLLGHSIVDARQIFSEAFLAKHLVEKSDISHVKEFPINVASISALEDLLGAKRGKTINVIGRRGLQKSALKKLLGVNALPPIHSVIEDIEFSSNIQSAIEIANNLDTKKFVAIHIRSGDIVYGREFRQNRNYHRKVINPGVVLATIERLRAKDDVGIILFGQDLGVLSMFRSVDGVIIANDVAEKHGLSLNEQAMFEVVLMSRADNIISGNSGFSEVASLMSGRPLTKIEKIFNDLEYADVTLLDLESREAEFHPLMAAYSYWQAYCLGHACFALPKCLEIIRHAARLDSENLRYLVIEVGILFKLGRDIDAEILLERYLEPGASDGTSNVDILLDQLRRRAKSSSPESIHHAEIEIFRGAANKKENVFAKLLVEKLEEID